METISSYGERAASFPSPPPPPLAARPEPDAAAERQNGEHAFFFSTQDASTRGIKKNGKQR